MTNTTYYNLNIVEGTDIVNPLTVDNPNYEIIDETMHNNAISGVTLATEIANATVHAINRENSECAVIRFIATSVWKAGDTITVDGVPVTALLPSGETLPDGAYVINSNVLCILTGTNMTVFAERKKTDNAIDIRYNSTNVGAELDKVNRNIENTNTEVLSRANTNLLSLSAGLSITVQLHTSYDRLLLMVDTIANTGNSGLNGLYMIAGRRSEINPIVTAIKEASSISFEVIANGFRITNNSAYNAVVSIISSDYLEVS